MTWRAHIEARLREIRPESICALDDAAHRLATGALPGTAVRRHGDASGTPCALALGVDALDGLDAPAAEHLISRVRLYVAPRILLAVPASCALDADAFRALGFTLSATDAAANRRVHYYDIDTYKTVPDWLNARFWAHPERWEP